MIGYVSIALGVVLYSSAAVFIQASAVPALTFTVWRLIAGVAVFILIAAGPRLFRSGPAGPSLRPIVVAGGVAFGLQQLTIAIAIKATSVVTVTLMNGLSPLVVGVLMSRLRMDRTSRGLGIGAVIAVAGVTLGSAEGFLLAESAVASAAAAALSVIAFALFTVTARVARSRGMATLPFLSGSTLVAAAMVILYALSQGGVPTAPVGRDAALVVATAVGPGVLGHFAMTWPLRSIPLMVPTVARLMVPFVAGSLAFLVLGEPLTQRALVGMALTTFGVAWVFRSSSRATTLPVGPLPA